MREGYLLNKNFVKPSKVCANPLMAVPTAAKAVEMTPSMALMIPWKTARIDPRAAVMVWKMPAIREPRESMREGIFLGYCGLVIDERGFWSGRFVCLFVCVL